MPAAKPNPKPTPPARPDTTTSQVVDPVWLGKALALTLAVALLCAYLTACLLFYQGAWQLVLHPSRNVDRTPANAGLAFTPVRFGDFNTGTPHLTGWWVPAQSSSPSTPTILYLHGGSGSLSDTLPTLSVLHNADLNVFAIDYRGFGASDPSKHPDADLMTGDAAAALDYLVSTQHIQAKSIIPMGSGLGASLAVQLAQNHTELPAVILDNPDPDPAATATAASPSRIIPVRQLFGDRFAIAGPLAHLTTPKLLIVGGPSADRNISPAALEDLSHHVANPVTIIKLPPDHADAALVTALHRFLDQYVQQATSH